MTTKKATKKTPAKKAPTKKDLEDQIKALQARVEELEAMLADNRLITKLTKKVERQRERIADLERANALPRKGMPWN